ncbi:MAG: FeoA domain-containing protein, partial [Lachnospiraceae bacterium]|nr:FeoA domain-containing protein [Lachnospiraceae bacterium]
MTLREMKIGDSCVIESVGGQGALRQHFLDMGLIPGTEVTLVKYAPLGDPMELKVHDYELTLRLSDAEKILVTETRSDKESGKKEENRDHAPIPHPGLGEGGIFHDHSKENRLPDGTLLTFALAGNQNSGKTTLFNQLTGANQHVGNFPGVTVDKKSGSILKH